MIFGPDFLLVLATGFLAFVGAVALTLGVLMMLQGFSIK